MMLVLSRKIGEKILIGPGIVVTVVEIDRGKIRLGIEAPKDVKIWRSELSLAVPNLSGPSVDPSEVGK